MAPPPIASLYMPCRLSLQPFGTSRAPPAPSTLTSKSPSLPPLPVNTNHAESPRCPPPAPLMNNNTPTRGGRIGGRPGSPSLRPPPVTKNENIQECALRRRQQLEIHAATLRQRLPINHRLRNQVPDTKESRSSSGSTGPLTDLTPWLQRTGINSTLHLTSPRLASPRPLLDSWALPYLSVRLPQGGVPPLPRRTIPPSSAPVPADTRRASATCPSPSSAPTAPPCALAGVTPPLHLLRRPTHLTTDTVPTPAGIKGPGSAEPSRAIDPVARRGRAVF